MPTMVACRQCGTTFAAKPVKVKAGTAKYCSVGCWGAARRARRVALTCHQCGQSFAVVACYANRGQYLYCSRVCYDAARTPPPKPSPPTRDETFDAIVSRTATCWEWTGYRYPNGYGQCGSGERGAHEYAHRRAWERASGAPIPDGLGIYHVCDNRACVRADDVGTYLVNGKLLPRRGHLFMGMTSDNVADKVAKGRQLKGTQIRNARLTERDVIEIRQRFTGRRGEMAAAARAYRVDSGTIRDLVVGKTWRHLL